MFNDFKIFETLRFHKVV